MVESIKPGIYPGMTNDDYHGHHGSYSKSSFADAEVYPYNLPFQRSIERTPKDNKKFDMGSAAHTAVLEPEKIERDVSVCPDELLAKNGARSTNAYKEWAAAQPKNVSLLTMKQWDSIRLIRDSVHNNPDHSEARSLLTGGLPEVSCFWEETFRGDDIEPGTGYKRMRWERETYDNEYSDKEAIPHKIMVKCRPDYLPANQVIVDLKTTARLIDRNTFNRHAYDMKYHWSAALTLRGLSKATGVKHRIYIFVVVEIEPPHEVAVYRADDEFVAIGEREVSLVMEKVAWCDLNNNWPGMPNRIQTVSLPGYVKYKQED
jgi:hypothetical protein